MFPRITRLAAILRFLLAVLALPAGIISPGTFASAAGTAAPPLLHRARELGHKLPKRRR